MASCPPYGLRVCFRPESKAAAQQYRGVARGGDCGTVANLQIERTGSYLAGVKKRRRRR